MAGQYTVRLQALLDTAKIEGQLKTLSTKTIRFTADSGNVTTTMRTMTDESGKVYKSIEKVNDATGKTTASLSETTKATKSLGGEFLTTVGKVMKFAAATAVIGAVTGAIYSGIEAIKEYDSALTDFRKVSDLSGDSLDAYAKKLGEAGVEVARTRTEMVEAATEFKKSGFRDEDSATLAKVASEFQNVADSELSAGDAASFIISQMKAFNITASDAEGIIDKVNEVSNNFAVSSTDISSGLTKTSASLATYGNTIDQTIGLTY